MEPTLVGVLVIALGFFAIFGDAYRTVTIAMLLTLLGSSAAVNLPALGGASVLAAPLFTGFVVLRLLLQRHRRFGLLSALAPSSPGFWLLLAIAYGIFAAFIIAPLFYGDIWVYPISRDSQSASLFSIQQLEFSSGNITQTVYAVGQVLLFAGVSTTVANASLRSRGKILDTLVLLGFFHVLTSLLDLATFHTGTSFLLDWLRSANYITWQASTVAGLKRISGLFPEASMYSIYSMAISGILMSLYLHGYRLRITRPLFISTICLLLISTSSTAYISIVVALFLVIFAGIYKFLARQETTFLRLVFGIMLTLSFTYLTIDAFAPKVLDQVAMVIDEMLLSKMDSDSGASRSRLNSSAFSNFLDTMGLGIGIGSVRTSSFVFTLLSNLGLLGTLAYALFIRGIVVAPQGQTEANVILMRACRFGMLGMLIGASVSLHVFELGSLFYILAALSLPQQSERGLNRTAGNWTPAERRRHMAQARDLRALAHRQPVEGKR
ncbi:O-antigen ligase family protein [Zavarzinia compransoris]|uniref:O-antigen ligase domain-containing protein n=1 Tax=Zavarzinia compransoris TaxID=1264899 RepID=A0A317E5B6_9PROT|nr:O-antigen ligase family protein [Zavarzinia compransoris]PWR21544.1 hypothetical protein DKG75_05925 [Zavarzinia compransoris]TDP45689.1 O-antigen ligase-like membrane protein [Zavarzinia compransoris]